jgi:hypothetical protein
MKINTSKPPKPETVKAEKPASSRLVIDKSLALATELSTPVESVDQLTWLLYGEKKIGKTSFVSKFPSAHFLMFEPGFKGLRIHYKLMGSIETIEAWSNFKQYVDLLCDVESHNFRTVPIDTIDLCYNACLAYVCKREGIDHPQDLGYGKGWKLVEREFCAVINKLAQSGLGIVFISHATEREFQERTGGKFDKIVPSMPNQAKNFISGIADAIVYYGYYGNERLITVRGSDAIESGHRMEENFWVASEAKKPLDDRDKVSGRIHSIPVGNSAQEAYDNFLAAFNNEQQGTGEPDSNRVFASLSDVPVKMEAKKK